MTDSNNYITFYSEFIQVLYLSKEVDSLQYSVGDSGWLTLGTRRVVFGGVHGKLSLRGKNKYGTNGATIIFGTNAEVICVGDIRTLINYRKSEEEEIIYDTSKAKFNCLFKDCKQLVFPPELNSGELAEKCFQSMFAGCTSLKAAPELPAQKLADSCYESMFIGCRSLENPPELPARELTDRCYESMFKGCTSLKEIPELPAEKLASFCYGSMFEGCTSLKISAFKFHAKELAEGCCALMFKDCTSLVEVIGEIPAQKLAAFCYWSMFEGCTSLISPPKLPAKELANYCYWSMFKGCTSLLITPRLPAKKLCDACYFSMFEDCKSLEQVTMMATDIEAKHSIRDWLINTSQSGRFYKNKHAQWPDNVVIPPNWEIREIEDE